MSSGLAEALAARRGHYNRTFRVMGKGLPPESMLGYLRRIEPIVDAAQAPARQPLLDALFTLGVMGLRRGLVSRVAQPSAFERALAHTLVAHLKHLNEQPGALVAALGNGYLRLWWALGEARACSWLSALAELGELSLSHEELLGAGLVLAWKQGMAEAREGALERGQQMNEALRERLFGGAELDERAERRFVRPASRAPLGSLMIYTRVGGFTGIGGPFSAPPELYRLGEQLFATDGERVRELFADVHGARLTAAGLSALHVLEHGSQDGATINPQGTVKWAEQRVGFDALRAPQSCVAAAGMVAVTLRTSHYVFVLGRMEAAAS